MTNEQLKVLADLLAKATPGEWRCREAGPSWELWSETLARWVAYAAKPVSDDAVGNIYPTIAESRSNAAAIVASVNFLRANLPAILEQQAEIERLKQQLSNSIRFAGGQGPHIVESGSVRSRTVYSVGEAIKGEA